ncbi:Uncharacterized low-complexity protein [Kingella potus]|uniref:Uncharacterized low-complexity protein n=1 Tax=Kingella potus TaxID=265175 RepID=A0A377R0R5_9NEIS|nr:hypothetical protein [Kingella potus]UOP00947.1 hypothetical protein LVJ84_00570 [Kingella potus]STR00605.1 Uncharacterized low-complexity protein [Kingella potus]
MKKSSAIALAGALLALGTQAACAAPAQKDMAAGKTVKTQTHTKSAEGKCGEGKCGATGKAAKTKAGEGKCGEGKCGATGKAAKTKAAEGKCGEGKCGSH